MFRRSRMSPALAASLALTCFAASARADAAAAPAPAATPSPAATPTPAQAVTPAPAAAPAAAPDLTGLWRFDPAHSDAPPRPDGGLVSDRIVRRPREREGA